MNKEFRQYVFERTAKALSEDHEYQNTYKKLILAIKNKDLEAEDDARGEMESRAEEICYMKGFNDAMKLVLTGSY